MCPHYIHIRRWDVLFCSALLGPRALNARWWLGVTIMMAEIVLAMVLMPAGYGSCQLNMSIRNMIFGNDNDNDNGLDHMIKSPTKQAIPFY